VIPSASAVYGRGSFLLVNNFNYCGDSGCFTRFYNLLIINNLPKKVFQVFHLFHVTVVSVCSKQVSTRYTNRTFITAN
jgi:hypothetical protein